MIGDVLWEPTSGRWADTNLHRFGRWLATERGVEVGEYAEQMSVPPLIDDSSTSSPTAS